MASYNSNDPMVELYIHETNGLIEQLETRIIESEREGTIVSAINEIFRVMHTIKGNSMMMQFHGIASCAHALEDLFDFLRSEEPDVDYKKITDFVLETVDYIKSETDKIMNNFELEDNEDLQERIETHLESLKAVDLSKREAAAATSTEPKKEKQDIKVETKLNNEEEKHVVSEKNKQYYLCNLRYEEDCQMVGVRAFSAISQLSDETLEINHFPADLDDEEASTVIENGGLKIAFVNDKGYDETSSFFTRVAFMKSLDLHKVDKKTYLKYNKNLQNGDNLDIEDFLKKEHEKKERKNKEKAETKSTTTGQKFISVKVSKLDQLMNFVSELVVSESMVTGNPDLNGLKLDNFRKAAKHMKKIMNDLQDVVMEIRMVPLALTFQKMHRLARDMSNKTSKKMELELLGQETEVDKNIIEHISDPIMHLVRNAIDHGLESNEERLEKGKDPIGKVVLEAKHAGGEILIMVRDDGKGLDREKILSKAESKGLLVKAKEEYSNEEAFELIFNAGFSTREQITGFSGRGVGMDVVAKGIERIGGQIQIKSELGKGTEFTIRIPLTLAIIDCILVKVGEAKYAVPITAIKQLFEAKEEDIIKDPMGHEMIMMMNKCIKVVRIHKIHGVESAVTKIDDGIFVLVENNDNSVGIFVDKLLGEYQLVVKNFSKYINYVQGVSGCALLGDGDISLILDPLGLSS
ncbi:chemotaxis protein CheA [Clostridium sp. 'deep sea']|uniref:chemotaxis protein CheA n=1 Tax=Clostridium sp. 'deep sea' TaxID=2779445 RepID=UPI00189665C3|nr:chemotaxis protein CheA [Clostridium sp. 'deep sea']QOR35334.1 chemotaxis protein CheA [Clostridium sp. 'deep sea']